MNKQLLKYLPLLLIAFMSLSALSQTTSSVSKKKTQTTQPTFFDIQKEFNDYWGPKNVINGYYEENGVTVKAAGWKQFKRWEYYWETRVDPTTGEFPKKNTAEVFAARQNNSGSRDNTTGNWTGIGPNSSTGGYAGIGRLNCVVFRPGDNSTYYVGSPSGGLWKTVDDGNNWTVLTDHNNVLGVSAAAVIAGATTATDIVYIGTGDRDPGSAWTLGSGKLQDNNGIGVLKSTDGGTTWNTTGLSFSASAGLVINSILLDPNNNNNILYASTNDAIYKTTDAGVNWTQVYTAGAVEMKFNPGNSSTIYASNRQGIIYRSTNAGANWSIVLNWYAAGARRIALGVSADEPSWVYALMANENNGLYGVYKSTDNGATYNLVYNATNLLGWNYDGSDQYGQSWYDLTIAADPTNASNVMLGGVNTWRSTNGGVGWTLSNHWSTAYGGVDIVHADKHCLAFQNGTSTLYECNDGGIYKSTDVGVNWTDKSNGLMISQIYRLDVSQTVPDRAIAGFQDNGTKTVNGSTWTDIIGGDGLDCMIDYTNANVQYGETPSGGLIRTTNNWGSSTAITTGLTGDAHWIMPLVMHPTTNTTIYAAKQDVFRSTNQGTSWTKISNWNGVTLKELAVAPSNANYIYTTTQGSLYKTTNGGTSWTNISTGLPLTTNSITYIAVKHDDPNTVWVSLGQFNTDGVYQSTDGGSTWTNISTGLPQIPVGCVVQNKQNTTQIELYAGTDAGVYLKLGTSNWTLFSTGLPNVIVTELKIVYNTTTPDQSKLRASTYGRGMWESNVFAQSSAPPVANFVADQTSVDKYETVTLTDLSTNLPDSWSWTITPATFNYVGGTSATSQNPQIEFSASGFYTVTLEVTNGFGSDTENKTDYIEVSNFMNLCEAGGTYNDEYITGVQLEEIQNTGTGDDHYHDYRNLVANLTRTNTYNITLSIANPYTADDLGVWIDWNQDGDFDDAGENVVCEVNNGAEGTYQFTVPADAMLGITSMRVRLKYDGDDCGSPCGITPYGEVEDYSINVMALPPAITTSTANLPAFPNTNVGSSSTSQNFTAEGTDLTTDITVTAPVEFEVSLTDGSGYGNSVTLTQTGGTVATTTIYTRFSPTSVGNKTGNIVLSSTGATSQNVAVSGDGVTPPPTADFAANITWAHQGQPVSFTDLSTNTPTSWSWTFAPATITYLGGTNATSQNPQVQFNASGIYTVTLESGNAGGNDSETKTNYITVSDLPYYCEANSTGNIEYLSRVQFVGIDNTSNRTPYTDYTYLTTDINRGQSYNITTTIGLHFPTDDIGVWIDWNQDGDFDDAGENVVCEINVGSPDTYSISVPTNATLGGTTMRIRVKDDGDDCGTPCGSTNYGEVEDYGVNVLPAIGTPGLWTGAVSTDWNTTGNWDDNNIPLLTTDVTIPSGLTNYPVIGATTQANCNNLNLATGTTLVLASDATGTGSLIVNGTVANNGTITSQRYLPGANQAWHMVGSPVNSLSIGGSSFNPGATDDFYAWDEPSPGTWVNFKNQDGSQGNPSFPVANGDNNFHAGKGYLIAYDAANPVKTFIGTPTTGTVNFTLSYHAVKSDWIYNSGWNLVSNPYPSSIDWALADKSDLEDNFAYIYDPNLGGGEGYTTTNSIIGPHQGYMVWAKPTANGASFSFTNSMKTHGGMYLKNPVSNDNQITLRLSGADHYNETSIWIDQNTQFNHDRDDALKLFSFNPDIPQLFSFSSDGAQLAINSIPFVDAVTTVDLGFLAPHEDSYTISLTEQSTSINHLIYLEDKLSGEMHNLTQHSYSFASGQGQINDRFTLHFGVTGIYNIEEWNLNVYSISSTLCIEGEIGLANLEIFDIQGRSLLSKKINLNGLYTEQLHMQSGIYVVKVYNGSHLKTKKLILK